MRQFSFILFLTLFAWASAQAQTGTLSAKVYDQQGPLPAVSISIPALKTAGVATNLQGVFSINLPGGAHKVELSYVGYVKATIDVVIEAGKTTDAGTIVLQPEPSMKEVLVRSTYARGEMSALSMRKNALTIMEVVSADGIGKLPDRNAAEAVQRMPGISIERDQGEGRYITVRGTPSQWSSTTVNGDRIPAAKTSGDLLGNRTVPLDILPSEFIQYIQVLKAITPEYEGDAIGGTVNFVTRTSPEKRLFSVTAAMPYHHRDKETGFNGTLMYGDRILKNKLGFMLLGTINKRPYDTDSYEVVYGNALHNVNTLDVRSYAGKRTTKGYNAAVDFKLTDNIQLFARGFYTSLLDNERNRKTMFFFEKTTLNQQLRWNAVDYLFKNYGGEAGMNVKLGKQLNMDAKFSLFESWAGYDGPSTVDKDRRGYYYGNWLQTGKFDNLVSVNGKNYKFLKGDEPNTEYVGDAPGNIQPHFDESTPFNPDNFHLDRYLISIRNIKESDRVGTLNFQYTALQNLTLKFGAKYRDKNSSYDRRTATWLYKTSAPKVYLSAYEKEGFPRAGNYFPELNNPYNQLAFPYPTLQSFIDPTNSPALMSNITYTMQDKTNSTLATANYEAREKVLAAYGMGEYRIGRRSTLVAGLRFEQTDVTTSSFRYNTVSKEITPVEGGKSYPAVLPMLHYILKPSKAFDLRAAITRTFARAAFNELSAYESVNPSSLTITQGNAELRPTFSWNYDVIGSYYMNNTSYISGGLFYKDLKDVVIVSGSQEERTIDGTSAQYQVSKPVNSETAFLYGLELIFSKKFTQLPGVLGGLGLNLNYTYTKSETSLEARDGEKSGLLNQSPNIFNAALMYERNGLSLRLAGNYRQAFLVEIRDDKMADRYQDQDFQLDFSVNYNFPRNITLFLEANNLTNQPLRYYHGTKGRPEQVEYYSSRGRIGIGWKL
ncbi:MAG: TonB-dependent receptor [Chitinophagaceae bacterium]